MAKPKQSHTSGLVTEIDHDTHTFSLLIIGRGVVKIPFLDEELEILEHAHSGAEDGIVLVIKYQLGAM